MHRGKTAIEASLKVVNVVGILDQKHGSTSVVVNGKKEKRCPIVPAMTCEEHFNIADYAFLNGFPSANGQVFVNYWTMKGKRPSKAVGNPGAEGYVKIVEEAVGKIDGQMIWKPDYDSFMEQMELAKRWKEKVETRKAIDVLLKAAKNPGVRLAAMANEMLNEINDEGLTHLTAAEQEAATHPAKARESLKAIVQKYSPLEVATRASNLLKKLK
ncbi:MAG TPA: hypothetical protein VFS19_05630 [Planctomycetota bacterium]|nr:hypothetical protein [Planctomycetota bacterium]